MRRTRYIFIAMVVLLSVLAVYNARQNAAVFFIEDYSNRINLSYQFALKKTGLLADIFYRHYEEAVGKMFNDYAGAPQDEKISIREKMLDAFMPVYENSQELGLRRLQFYLADGTCLIRFHKPQTYGDPMLPFRESIQVVTQTQRCVSGFEEGRFWTGFRYVYPVFFNGRHIGILEMGFDFDAIKREMSMFTGNCLVMFLKRDLIEKKLFDKNEINDYRVCNINDDFIVEKNYRSLIKRHTMLCECLSFDLDDVRKKMDSLTEFNKVIRDRSTLSLIHFLPIKNIASQKVGYIVTVIENLGAPSLTYFFYAKIFIGAVCLISLMLYWNSRIDKLNRQLRQKSDKLKVLSITDPLTGQYNRLKTEQILLCEFERFKRYGEDLSLLVLDIDRFKDVNDTYGHDCGDKVLTEFCSLVSKNLRAVDILGRWGGEEFVVVCPGTSMENGVKAAENLRTKVEAHSSFAPVPQVTVSIGVSAFCTSDHAYSDALKRADVALYDAKYSGRNRVCSNG